MCFARYDSILQRCMYTSYVVVSQQHINKLHMITPNVVQWSFDHMTITCLALCCSIKSSFDDMIVVIQTRIWAVKCLSNSQMFLSVVKHKSNIGQIQIQKLKASPSFFAQWGTLKINCRVGQNMPSDKIESSFKQMKLLLNVLHRVVEASQWVQTLHVSLWQAFLHPQGKCWYLPKLGQHLPSVQGVQPHGANSAQITRRTFRYLKLVQICFWKKKNFVFVFV